MISHKNHLSSSILLSRSQPPPTSRRRLAGRAATFALLTGLAIAQPAQAFDAGTNETFVDNGFNTMNVGGVLNDPAVYTVRDGYTKDFANGYSGYLVYLGFNTHWNQLKIQNGGKVIGQYANLYIGYGDTSNYNSLLVEGSGSSYSTAVSLIIGGGGSYNHFQVSGGASANVGTLVTIGSYLSANDNSGTVTGGSTLTAGQAIDVGYLGSRNSFIIEGGSTFTNGGGYASTIGYGQNSSLTEGNDNSVIVRGANSTWTNTKGLVIGYYGSGNSFTIEGGGVVSNVGSNLIGVAGGMDTMTETTFTADHNSVTVSGAGSEWNNNGLLYVGQAGSYNSLLIENGGSVSLTGGGREAVIGKEASASRNEVRVNGFGSAFTITGALKIGELGLDNSLIIESGALVQAETLSITTSNFLRLDGGFLALEGDQTSALNAFITGGSVQWWDGSDWVVGNSSNFSVEYFALGEDALAFSGYNGLGDYTLITSVAAVPEPGTFALLGLGAAALAYIRRKRN